jgi:hypothetical protein
VRAPGAPGRLVTGFLHPARDPPRPTCEPGTGRTARGRPCDRPRATGSARHSVAPVRMPAGGLAHGPRTHTPLPPFPPGRGPRRSSPKPLLPVGPIIPALLQASPRIQRLRPTRIPPETRLTPSRLRLPTHSPRPAPPVAPRPAAPTPAAAEPGPPSPRPNPRLRDGGSPGEPRSRSAGRLTRSGRPTRGL